MRRRRALPVHRFDADRWVELRPGEATAPDPAELLVTTVNVWLDDRFADRRHRATADLLGELRPDLMVFQEITAPALEVFLGRPWIREHYLASWVTAGVGDYGMLLLSRLPADRVTYVPLPSRAHRGVLRADFTVAGRPLTVCSVHLDSGKRSARRRGRQLRRLFRMLRGADDAVVLGDFNMRDAENHRIAAPYRDVWPALRPDEPGYTEDTSINLMRLDSKGKHRQVRFDRVLVKGRRWAPVEIDLLGTRPVAAALPRVFPSDHFGVSCRLEHHPAAEAPRERRGRRWLRPIVGR